MKNEIIIFTDGASRGNPGPGGWGSIVVVDKKEVIELGGREEHTTNNRMELTAAIEALCFISSTYNLTPETTYNLVIYTDSSYVLQGITKWVFGWKKKKWMTAQEKNVLNRDLWEKLSSLVDGIGKKMKVTWNLVSGHSGVYGNERCDVIATEFADGKHVELYCGMIEKYGQNILNVDHDETKKNIKKYSKSHSRQKAYSYLSMIDGEIKKHKTWKECEKRVKGKSGAKYKKALTMAEEKKIIEEWRERV